MNFSFKYKTFILTMILVLVTFSSVYSINIKYKFKDNDEFIYSQKIEMDISRKNKDLRFKVDTEYKISIKNKDKNFVVTAECINIDISQSAYREINLNRIRILKKGEKWIGTFNRKGKLLEENYRSSVKPLLNFIIRLSDKDLTLNKEVEKKSTKPHKNWGYIRVHDKTKIIKQKLNLIWIEKNHKRSSQDGTYSENTIYRNVYDRKLKRIIRGAVINKDKRGVKIGDREMTLSINWKLTPHVVKSVDDGVDW